MLRRIGFLGFLLLLAGCNGETGAGPHWLLRAGFGETVTLPGSSLAITFAGVPLDSRCPADVACAWSGEVTVELTVDDDAGAPLPVSFTVYTDGRGRVTGSAQNSTAETTYGDYRIALRKVDPYPEHHAEPVPVEVLGVTLEVGLVAPATPEAVTPTPTAEVVTPEATPASRHGSPPPPRGTPAPTPAATPIAQGACPDGELLPVVCLNLQVLTERVAGVNEVEPLQLGAEVAGCALTSQADGDAICAALGEGWIMADADIVAPSSIWREFMTLETRGWTWDWDAGAPVAP